jgi:cytidylate kinase
MRKRFRNVVISGGIGTGKSTLARNLAKELGWEMISSGEWFRRWHEENGFPLDRPDLVPKDVDEQLDYGLQQKMRDDNRIVFESHLGGWLARDLPETFKVLCTAEWDTMISRAAKRDGKSFLEEERFAKKRGGTLQEKFERLYKVKDTFAPEFFDLVVDTTTLTPEEVLKQVIDNLS